MSETMSPDVGVTMLNIKSFSNPTGAELDTPFVNTDWSDLERRADSAVAGSVDKAFAMLSDTTRTSIRALFRATWLAGYLECKGDEMAREADRLRADTERLERRSAELRMGGV